MNLFDGMDARDAAIDKVEAGSEPRILRQLRQITLDIAKSRGERGFTTDAVWAVCDHQGLKPDEPRVMGAVIRNLASQKCITKTGEYKKSVRAECHSRDIPIWRYAQ